jgi:hypothetical protein
MSDVDTYDPDIYRCEKDYEVYSPSRAQSSELCALDEWYIDAVTADFGLVVPFQDYSDDPDASCSLDFGLLDELCQITQDSTRATQSSNARRSRSRDRYNNSARRSRSRDRYNNSAGRSRSRDRYNNSAGRSRSRDRYNNSAGRSRSRDRYNNSTRQSRSRDRYNNSTSRSRSRDRYNKRHRNHRSTRSTREDFTAFVCNISFDTSEADVRAFFEQNVKIKKWSLVDKRDDRNKICKRFALVTVYNARDFEKLLDCNDRRLDNRRLLVRVHRA